MAYGFSILANHPKDLHLMDIELSEFDVWISAVVSDPSDPDIVKAKNLDGENLSLSKPRSRHAFDFSKPVVKLVSDMDKRLHLKVSRSPEVAGSNELLVS